MNFHSLLHHRNVRSISILSGAALLLGTGTWASRIFAPAVEEPLPFEESRIYFEYNSTDNDLGIQVKVDAENWVKLGIASPAGKQLLDIKTKGGFKSVGLSELFFEGTEPVLDQATLDELLKLFPEGEYAFAGKTTEGENLAGTGTLTHAIPAGPEVTVDVGSNNSVVVSWKPVTGTPAGFPDLPISIVGYEIIVEPFDVTLPGTATSVTVSPEFVASLEPGRHTFEVLAIDVSGNQSITEGTFDTQ